MLGLGLLGLHDLGFAGWRWVVLDVLWAVAGALLIGSVLGALIGKLVVYLRSRHKESVGYDEFLVLGLIALSYGLAQLAACYGFLAVFTAGLALQRVKENPARERHPARLEAGLQSRQAHEALATNPRFASAYMMQEVQGFTERLERIAEFAIVLVAGAMLSYAKLPGNVFWFLLLQLLVARPLAVWLGLLGAPVSRDQRLMTCWFGIRGIGSIYYLMYAINHGVSAALASDLVAITLLTVTASIILHGISVTPLMKIYTRRRSRVG